MILSIYLGVLILHFICMSLYVLKYDTKYYNYYTFVGILLTGIIWPLFWGQWLYNVINKPK